MTTRGIKRVYAVLAAAGAAGTWYCNINFMIASGGGFDLAAFLRGGFANYAAGSLSVDAGVAAIVFIVWLTAEAGRLGMRHRWVYIVLTFTVALAFAFPFFLYMRERYREHAAPAGQGTETQ